MGLSPSQKTSIRYQFEVYCKKVIRGERGDYLRQVIRQAEREIGALLGIPRSTIQRCRQRFLDQMKQLLKE